MDMRTYTSLTKVSWESMKSRCNNKNNKSYKHYGGRGIGYDPRWERYEEFLCDMGLRPNSLHSLERLDVNANYSKENCTWAVSLEQQNNRRNTIRLTAFGKTQHIRAWSDELQIPTQLIRRRYLDGWAHADCLITNRGKCRKRSERLLKPWSSRPGESNPSAKLTADMVRFIRSTSLSGLELASVFGVSPATISAIRVGRIWKSLN